MHLGPPDGLGCYPFWGSGSVVVDFCLLLLPLWVSVVDLCFVVRYFIYILVLQSYWWGGGAGCFAWFVFLVSRGGWVALPRGAMGLSAVCDCDIS